MPLARFSRFITPGRGIMARKTVIKGRQRPKSLALAPRSAHIPPIIPKRMERIFFRWYGKTRFFLLLGYTDLSESISGECRFSQRAAESISEEELLPNVSRKSMNVA